MAQVTQAQVARTTFGQEPTRIPMVGNYVQQHNFSYSARSIQQKPPSYTPPVRTSSPSRQQSITQASHNPPQQSQSVQVLSSAQIPSQKSVSATASVPNVVVTPARQPSYSPLPVATGRQQVHSYTPAPMPAVATNTIIGSFTPAPFPQRHQQIQVPQAVQAAAVTQHVVQQPLPSQRLIQPAQSVVQVMASQAAVTQQAEAQGVPQHVLQQVQQHVQQQSFSARAATQVAQAMHPNYTPLAQAAPAQELLQPTMAHAMLTGQEQSASAPAYYGEVPAQDQWAYGQHLMIDDPVSNRATARDTSVAFMPYFAIRDMDNFLDVCNQCIEVVKNETLCLGYGFTISSGSQNSLAFCREAFANADGVIAHLHNIEILFKEGLCRYGELVSLQIHGPKVELDRLQMDPMIQEMNPEFFELLPNSFEVIEIPMQRMEYYSEDIMGEPVAGLQQEPMMPEPLLRSLERSAPLVIEAAPMAGDLIPAVVQARVLGTLPAGVPKVIPEVKEYRADRNGVQMPRRTPANSVPMAAQPTTAVMRRPVARAHPVAAGVVDAAQSVAAAATPPAPIGPAGAAEGVDDETAVPA